MKTIAVIGSGSWGVALSMHLASLGHNVRIWSFDEEEARLINEERKCKFLPKIVIPSNIVCKTNFKEVIEGADFILHVTPSKFTRNIVKQYKEFVDCEKQPIVVCSKGIEKDTALTLDEVIKQEIPNARVGALSGPSHAEEVSIAVPTVLVAASKDAEVRKLVQDTFMNEKMRIYTSEDIKGVELGGALKNIIAFCAGVAAGLGYGDNTFAALITRGLTEIRRLGLELGAESQTLYGLSGLGDLIVTCLSEHSRNRKAGKLIGQGKTIEETKKEVGMTIESIDNIEVAKSLSQKLNISMPIVDAVYDILYNNLEPNEAVKMLMTRDKKMED
ncbi:MAG: NAD(P)-dependent glycerol-3-phosphate dehydrogenase [Clostridia bacterium]|nr:NAD(P)-dependent glycerol-3-phosphate dehydrogenase [Clostridia bacterium]